MTLHHISRSRWAAVGASIAISMGAGGVLTSSASIGTGERAVYVPITPCRVIDTRPAPDTVGSRTAPLGPGESLSVAVRGTNGNCTIPLDAVGVVMNVAAVGPTAASFLTVFPSDAPRPLAANLNWLAGDPPLSNAVTADISADGRVSFYNLAGTVHVAADIVGYYVDHTHDDRYFTEAESDARYDTVAAADARYYPKADSDARYVETQQTLAFDGSYLQPLGTTQLGTSNSCAAFASAGAAGGRLPLVMPVGARISTFHVWMYDGSPDNYTVQLQRSFAVPGTMSATITTIGTATGGAESVKIVKHDVVLASIETVDANETFFLNVALGATAFSNGICQVTVDIVAP